MIYIGADHRGFRLKNSIINFLIDRNELVKDVGNSQVDNEDDYVDFGLKVAERVKLEQAMGILICGSGVGMSIVANKVKGVRAGLCLTMKQARLAVEDDNINILCLAADLVSQEKNIKIVSTFLRSRFTPEERHIRRINKINKYETTNN